MSAHLRPLQIQCQWHGWHGCTKRALVEVFNRYNASQGKFCRRHGSMRVKDLQADEKVVREAEGRRR
jgi:hypothetical protein